MKCLVVCLFVLCGMTLPAFGVNFANIGRMIPAADKAEIDCHSSNQTRAKKTGVLLLNLGGPETQKVGLSSYFGIIISI